MIPIAKSDIDNPERLFQLLRNMLSLIYTNQGVVERIVQSASPRNILDGTGQPATARLILGIRELGTIKCNLPADRRPAGAISGVAPHRIIQGPASTDDFTQQFSVGSIWIFNTGTPTTNEIWVCVAAGFPNPGTAVWKEVA